MDAVLRLWSAARSAHASMSDRREDVEALTTADNPAAMFVAEMDGQLIGAVIAGWDGWRGSVYRLAVRSDHRRNGIGLQLARAAEDYFRAHGVGRVTALVPFDDEPANGFWEAAGYRGITRSAAEYATSDRAAKAQGGFDRTPPPPPS